jgi:hypothetical protein
MLQARRLRDQLLMGSLIFFSAPNPSSSTIALGFTQPVTEMNTGKFFRVKRGPCVRLTT